MIKEQFVVEYIVSWLRTIPEIANLKNQIRAYEFLPDSPVPSIMIGLQSFEQPNPEIIPGCELFVAATAASMQDAKDNIFTLYEVMRYRFGIKLPVPNPIPRNATNLNLEPITIGCLEPGEIRLSGPGANGEFRYTFTLNVK